MGGSIVEHTLSEHHGKDQGYRKMGGYKWIPRQNPA